MRVKIVLLLSAFIIVIIQGCKHVSPEPSPVYIKSGYQISGFYTPCGFGGVYIESNFNANGVYTLYNYCEGGSYSNTQTATASVFNSRTYAADYMAAATDGGAYSVIPIRSYAPAGTVKCYSSADGAHIVCDNAAGVITYREEHPSVHGVLDADGAARLLFYQEQNTPF